MTDQFQNITGLARRQNIPVNRGQRLQCRDLLLQGDHGLFFLDHQRHLRRDEFQNPLFALAIRVRVLVMLDNHHADRGPIHNQRHAQPDAARGSNAVRLPLFNEFLLQSLVEDERLSLAQDILAKAAFRLLAHWRAVRLVHKIREGQITLARRSQGNVKISSRHHFGNNGMNARKQILQGRGDIRRLRDPIHRVLQPGSPLRFQRHPVLHGNAAAP